MRVHIRFFASVREALGTSQESVDLPSGVTTVGEVRAFLRARGGTWEQTLAEGRSLRMAYNQQMTGPETLVSEGGEVAFFPPVTGG